MKKLIPKPNGFCDRKEGQFAIEKLRTVYHEAFSNNCVAVFEERVGIHMLPVCREEAVMVIEEDPVLATEAYRLKVDTEHITIFASSMAGVILALTTLYSLREQEMLPCMDMEDEPQYAHRGFMLDCARHYFSVQVIEEVIEQCALVKLNVFHWHLTDDQGWRIESKVFPKLQEGSNPDCYTQEEIKHIVTYAKMRGIEVIPELDIPGHTLAMLAAYPQLSCKGGCVETAKTGGIFSTILCAGKDRTYEFLYSLIDELCTLFPSKYFHVGGDEAPKSEWEQCEDCKKMMAKEHYTDFNDLQAHFTTKISEHLSTKGKIPICWNDILKSDKYPPNMVAQYWVEFGATQGTMPFIQKGGRTIFSDMFYLYFDYTESLSNLRRVYEYTPKVQGIDCSLMPETWGIQACLWTERIKEKELLEKMLYPRLFALAEAAWTRNRDYSSFEKRLEDKMKELSTLRINYTPLSKCNPTGEEKKLGVQQFLQAFAEGLGKSGEGKSSPLPPEVMGAFMRGFGLEELL